MAVAAQQIIKAKGSMGSTAEMSQRPTTRAQTTTSATSQEAPKRFGGQQVFRQMLEGVPAAFTYLHFTIEDQSVAGDKVATLWSAKCAHTGPLGEIQPTGKSVKIDGLIVDSYRRQGLRALGAATQPGMPQQLGLPDGNRHAAPSTLSMGQRIHPGKDLSPVHGIRRSFIPVPMCIPSRLGRFTNIILSYGQFHSSRGRRNLAAHWCFRREPG